MLKINSKTWKKFTEDLFDFEAEDMTLREFKINKSDISSFLYIESKFIFL